MAETDSLDQLHSPLRRREKFGGVGETGGPAWQAGPGGARSGDIDRRSRPCETQAQHREKPPPRNLDIRPAGEALCERAGCKGHHRREACALADRTPASASPAVHHRWEISTIRTPKLSS